MAHASVAVTIERPVEDVFAVLTDPTMSPKWSANAIKGELITDGPPGIGTRRRTVVKGPFGGTMESVMEVTELEPQRAVGLRLISASWGGTGWTRYTFASVEGGTRVCWVWDMELDGWKKPLSGPFMAVFERGFQRDLETLKRKMGTGEL
jgi:uncharacterized protein YndB with AHSA1/START domain